MKGQNYRVHQGTVETGWQEQAAALCGETPRFLFTWAGESQLEPPWCREKYDAKMLAEPRNCTSERPLWGQSPEILTCGSSALPSTECVLEHTLFNGFQRKILVPFDEKLLVFMWEMYYSVKEMLSKYGSHSPPSITLRKHMGGIYRFPEHAHSRTHGKISRIIWWWHLELISYTLKPPKEAWWEL